jgi:hypothetical protein
VSISLPLLLLTGMALGEANVPAEKAPTHYDNYTAGFKAAQKTGQPLLVILNPGGKSAQKPVTLESVRKSKTCCDWLESYVVVIVDTETDKGGVIHTLFGAKPLPHVSVIDKAQKFQIYTTSKSMQLSDWDRVLKTYRKGVAVSKTANLQEVFCPT